MRTKNAFRPMISDRLEARDTPAMIVPTLHPPTLVHGGGAGNPIVILKTAPTPPKLTTPAHPTGPVATPPFIVQVGHLAPTSANPVNTPY